MMKKAIKILIIIIITIILIVAFLILLPLLKPDIVPRDLDTSASIEIKIVNAINRAKDTGKMVWTDQIKTPPSWVSFVIDDNTCLAVISDEWPASLKREGQEVSIIANAGMNFGVVCGQDIEALKDKILEKYDLDEFNPELLKIEEACNLIKGERCVLIYGGEGIQYIEVDDFFGEWPIYYDEYVEFEGYVTSVYDCPPCPRGAQCEACIPPYYLVYKEPLSHKYYETGHVIVKHRFGEKLEIGKKYKIRGRLLPPEQAFTVGVIGSIPNSESRIVIHPTEPAVEVE